VFKPAEITSEELNNVRTLIKELGLWKNRSLI
jgi:hypothetical protein